MSSPDGQPGADSVKIAVATNNGETINRHFGRARFYMVVTVEGGEVVARELRPKAGHDDFAGHGHADHESGASRGHGDDARAKHRAMTDSIRDCHVLIAGGMGQGAFGAVQEFGIGTVMTDERDISVAIERYLRADLPNLGDRLH